MKAVFVILLVSFGWLAVYNFLTLTVNYVSYCWKNRKRVKTLEPDRRFYQVYGRIPDVELEIDKVFGFKIGPADLGEVRLVKADWERKEDGWLIQLRFSTHSMIQIDSEVETEEELERKLENNLKNQDTLDLSPLRKWLSKIRHEHKELNEIIEIIERENLRPVYWEGEENDPFAGWNWKPEATTSFNNELCRVPNSLIPRWWQNLSLFDRGFNSALDAYAKLVGCMIIERGRRSYENDRRV